ncbi:MAG: transcriptional regulator [Alphaproteobacteria bacterium CG_4_9_14_3_um_filter_47_13]|nr:MAG: transcriptional regulator [Alphaproteobacteria bacterium CG_4_9_14_3_um_filter_47_13]
MMEKKEQPNPVDIHVGERLKSRRILLSMSQEKLADAVGITFQQIQKYERGTNRVSASRLWQFSKVLHVSISYFFENFSEKRVPATQYTGMSDNDQETLLSEENLMDKKETIKLIREYYSIPDEKMRKDLFKMIKTMAANMRNSG